jgi:hypothetical protein
MCKRTNLIFALAVLVVVVSGMLTPALAKEGAPDALLETPTYDFGTSYEGIDLYHDFVIKNNGDADLEIKEVKSG